jgi:hypothetical protein
MQRVGGAQRNTLQRQQEVLRSAVHIAGQLDSMVPALVEAPEDRALKPPRGLSSERSLVQPPRDGRDDLRDSQIGHEDIVPALDDLVELVATGFGQVELQQGAGVAVERAGQLCAIGGPSFGEACRRASPRGDLPVP